MEIKESWSEDGSRGAHLVLVVKCGPLHVATERLKDGLIVRIDNDRRICTTHILITFDLRLF